MGTCSSKEAASAGPVDEASILIKPDALADAAKLGDAAELRRLLEAGVDPDFHCGESKGTALHLAALNGHAECARALLEFGADADARDKDESTALHRAAAKGALEVVQALLERHASVDAADRFGNAALHRAASVGQADVIKLLLDGGNADLRCVDTCGNTALHMAAASGRAEATQLLLSRGADVGATNSAGSTPLHWAVLEGRKETSVLLLAHGADPKARTQAGSSCLDMALLSKMRDTLSQTAVDPQVVAAASAAAAAYAERALERTAAKRATKAAAAALRAEAATKRTVALAEAASAAAALRMQRAGEATERAAFKAMLGRNRSLHIVNSGTWESDGSGAAVDSSGAVIAEAHAEGRAATLSAVADMAAQCGGLVAVAAGLIKAAADAYARVLANHARCRLLLERMQLLQPCLEALGKHLASPAARKAEGLAALRGTALLLERLRDTFRDAVQLIESWGFKGAGFFGALKLALAAPRFGSAFDAVRAALEARMQELQLDAVIAARVAAVNTRAWEAQDDAASRADVAALPESIARLAEDREALNELLAEAGTSRQQLTEALKKQGVSFGDVDKSLARVEALVAAGNRELDAKLDSVMAALASGVVLGGGSPAPRPGAAVARPAGMLDWRDIRLTGSAPVGAGGFGSVWLGTWRGTPVAVKRLGGGASAAMDKRAERDLFRESAIMSALPPSPHVVQLYGAVLQAPNYALIMEFCEVPGGRPHDRPCNSLDQLLRDDDVPLPWADRLRIALGVAAGLATLHAAAVGPAGRPIVHGDLKSANVLLTPGPRGVRYLPKLTDFGLSRVVGATVTMMTGGGAEAAKGTLRWRAPELLRGGRPSAAADVYALGMVCFEIASRRYPFENCRDDVLPSIIAEGRQGPAWPSPPTDEAAPDAAAALADVMERCWAAEAWRRPEAAALVAALEGAVRAEEARAARAAAPALDELDSVPLTKSSGWGRARALRAVVA